MKRHILSLLGLFAANFASVAQLTIDASLTPEQYVQNVLLGGGVTVSNVTFNGNPGNVQDPNMQIGSFDASMANVGINQGIILASGDVNVALGPNSNGGADLPAGGYNIAGDPDLDQIVGIAGTNDAAVLEFDFIPSGDSLNFNFVFASEEYLEFVNAGFNDPFGFFISGPGFTGPFTGGAENIALIPGTATPVTIDNLNDVTNSQYYIDNGDGTNAPFNNDAQYIQFDGLTTVLTASAQVICGQTYHIKLAVADAGDAALDSGVFLEGGSFTSANAVTVNVNTVSASGILVEGCAGGDLVITRPDTVGDLVVDLSLTGTAVNGVDYTQVPQPITIPSGSNSVMFPISAIQDNIVEGQEDIIFTTVFVNACGDSTISTVSIIVQDYDPIVLVPDPTQFLNCSQDSIPLQAIASGGFGNLNYQWSNGTPGGSIWVPGMADGNYTITVSDDCNMSQSATINVNAGCEVIIPNVFSPNADGWNDAFEVQGIIGTQNVVRIFNRWGMVVFEQTNYRNNWRAADVSDGTYYYEIIVKGTKEPYTGHLTILR